MNYLTIELLNDSIRSCVKSTEISPDYQENPKNSERPEQYLLRSFGYAKINGEYTETIKRMRYYKHQ